MDPAEALARSLVAEAACAGLPGSLAALDKALEWGQRAAAEGHALPLPLLLDLTEWLERPEGQLPGPTDQPAVPEPGPGGFDRWVWELAGLIRYFVGVRQEDLSLYQTELSPAELQRWTNPDLPRAGEPDILPFLLWAVPPVPVESHARLSEAFRILRRSEPLKADLDRAWRGPRPPAGDPRWRWWAERGDEPSGDPSVAGLWSRFATEAGSAWLHERLDHVSAEVYLQGGAVDPTSQQARRLDFLQRRRSEVFFTPMTTCYEELDPFQGAIALSTLSMGDYGMYKIANRSAVWISNPPSARPSHKVHVHLTWTTRFEGLLQSAVWSTLAEGSEESDSLEVSAASLLQGIVALVVDDWRSALRHLPVQFHLHRDGEDQEGLNLGVGGPRWRGPGARTGLPPAHVVARIFRRNSLADLAASEADWTVPTGSADNSFHYWFGFILASDLRSLGFRDWRESDGTVRGWEGPPGRLPDCLSRLVLLEPAVGLDWTILDIQRERDDLLSPRIRCPEPGGEPHPYPVLRRATLDVLLEALDRRMT